MLYVVLFIVMANYAVLVKGNIGPIDRLFPASTKPLTKHGDPLLFQSSSHMNKRPRRLRFTPRMRSLTRENHVSTDDFVYPLFIHDDEPSTKPSLGRAQKDPIHSMPGIYRHNLASMMEEVRESVSVGIRSFVLFPKISPSLKDHLGSESHNPDGLIPRAISLIKAQYPDVMVVTDVALDPYSSQGHDGVVGSSEDGKVHILGGNAPASSVSTGASKRISPPTMTVLNDLTVKLLCQQAVMQAKAGSDMIAPSDMMDGRVGAIREALDEEGFAHIPILSYTAKYASEYYGPFRDALNSHPDSDSSGGVGDKKGYQMDPGNVKEALVEQQLDEAEGADILMVKPGLPYLDVIRDLHTHSKLPIAVYHVSGEYSMIKAAVEKGWLNEKETVLETMLCFKRAGAKIIFSYYAKQCAIWLKEQKDP